MSLLRSLYVQGVQMLRLNIHYFSSRVRQRIYAPVFMPCPRPLAHASNTKEATPKGIPPKNRCGAEGSEAGAPPPVFGGEGRRPVLHIDKGNATCNLFKKLKNHQLFH